MINIIARGQRMIIQYRLIGAVYLGILSLCTTSATAALIGRLPATPGGTNYQAYYDDQLNISWARDVNVNGLNTWANHTSWAANLDIGGVTGWRLPSVDVNGDGTVVNCASASASACLDNEYGYQLYRNGITLANPGPFTHFNQSGLYVSSTEYAPNPVWVWDVSLSVFSGINGFGAHGKTGSSFIAWAVHDGDVGLLTGVPVPAAAWLFGSGLLGLIAAVRRKAA